MCEENKEKELEEKNNSLLKYFAVKGSTLEACRRTVLQPIQAKLTTRIVQNHKGISTVRIKQQHLFNASFGCSHGNESQKS